MFYNSMNINQLKGKVVGEPEYKETKNGKKLLTFNLLYFTRQTTDSEGSHSNFIQVEAWEKTADLMAPLLTRGLEVLVNGSIVQKRWTDEEGKPRSQFVFTADALSITDLHFSVNPEQQEAAAE